MSGLFDERQIKGQIAAIEDEYTVLINRGENYGVRPGLIFAIYDDTGEDVLDPETGRPLGPIPTEKLRVKVFDVFPNACRAKTYRSNSPFARSLLGSSSQLAKALGGRDTIESEEMKEAESKDQVVVTVNIGDVVKSVDKQAAYD